MNQQYQVDTTDLQVMHAYLTAAQSNSGSWTAGEVIAMISREIVRPRKISYNLARDRYQCTKSYPFNTSSKRRKLEETARQYFLLSFS